MGQPGRGNLLSRLVRAATKVEANEQRATLVSFVFVFCLMAAYFIMRPARDALASDWTDEQLSWLWTSTFIFSVIAVSIYGGVISRIRFKVMVPAVYVFFASTFVGFYIVGKTVGESDLVNRAFYVWLSVFSLFHLSVFWSFMSGIYNKDQAKRTFAVIATGAMLGAAAGPIVPLFFADDIGALNLLLIGAVVLLLPLPLIRVLERLRVEELGNDDALGTAADQQPLSANPFSGFGSFISSPYLLAIGLFILFYVMMNTFIYYELRDALGQFERDVRAQYWAGIDFAVNWLAVLTALFATSRLATRAGMPVTLALIPLLMVGGWIAVALSPVLMVLIGLQVARRAGNYAITRPGREMLFTVVDPDTRFKAKPVIDIVVYRGGDVATAWIYTAVTATLGIGLAGVALLSAAICAAWVAAGVFLGRKYDRVNTADEQGDQYGSA
jgi:AAA family ATP:ADP antiporter